MTAILAILEQLFISITLPYYHHFRGTYNLNGYKEDYDRATVPLADQTQTATSANQT